MGRTKVEMAESLLKISSEIAGLSSGIDEILSWLDDGEDPRVIHGALEHHPHLLAVMALRLKALATDLSQQAAEDATAAVINQMRL
jgi:hypothetical protein